MVSNGPSLKWKQQGVFLRKILGLELKTGIELGSQHGWASSLLFLFQSGVPVILNDNSLKRMFILASHLSAPHQLSLRSSVLNLTAKGVLILPPLWLGARDPRLRKNIGVWSKISREKHDMYRV
jgi:hypothetical protein